MTLLAWPNGGLEACNVGVRQVGSKQRDSCLGGGIKAKLNSCRGQGMVGRVRGGVLFIGSFSSPHLGTIPVN